MRKLSTFTFLGCFSARSLCVCFLFLFLPSFSSYVFHFSFASQFEWKIDICLLCCYCCRRSWFSPVRLVVVAKVFQRSYNRPVAESRASLDWCAVSIRDCATEWYLKLNVQISLAANHGHSNALNLSDNYGH